MESTSDNQPKLSSDNIDYEGLTLGLQPAIEDAEMNGDVPMPTEEDYDLLEYQR